MKLRTFFLLTLFSCFFFTFSHAQSWQWVKRFGSSENKIPGKGQDEQIIDMKLDSHGNVYVLTSVMNNSLNASGIPQTPIGLDDIMLSSFDCDGNLRWNKVIGTNRRDYAAAIAVDRFDGVYIAGQVFTNDLSANTIYIGNDTSFKVGMLYQKSLILIKYDTAGKLKWFRMPQPDTVTYASICPKGTGPVDMDVDSMGNVHLLCYLPPGAYANGQFVAKECEDYMLRYDRNGNFIGINKLELEDAIILKFRIDPVTQRYYFSGGTDNITPIYVGSKSANTYDSVLNTQFVLAFAPDGKYIWRLGNTGGGAIESPPVTDKNGDIYITGTTHFGDTINGYVVQYQSLHSRPYLLKVDRNGKNIWGTNPESSFAASGGVDVAIRTEGEVVLSVAATNILVWPGQTQAFPVPAKNDWYDIFVTSFNTRTGKLLKMESILGGGATYDRPTVSIGDGRGNAYIGGYFGNTLYPPNDTIYSTGGDNDGVVAKFGLNQCGCTLPTPSFQPNQNGNTVTPQYTGSQGYKSILWDFGDGNTSALANPVHSYSSYGVYTMCVTVTNNCGSDVYCQYIMNWPVSVSNLTTDETMKIYPNPAGSTLNVETNTQISKIEIYDMLGKLIMAKNIPVKGNNILNISSLAQGQYIITTYDNAGNRHINKFIKD